MTEELLSYRNITINRIVSSDILEVDTFCQKEAEWVVLLAGNAQIKMQGTCYNLHKGDSLFIPPMTEHTITRVTRGTIWLTVHIYEEER